MQSCADDLNLCTYPHSVSSVCGGARCNHGSFVLIVLSRNVVPMDSFVENDIQ
jgi:hypothetical protein